MRLRVHHRTRYDYPSPATDSCNDLRLCPRNTPSQKCESSLIYVLPPASLSHYFDLNQNVVHHFEVPDAHTSLTVTSKATVLTKNPVDFDHLPYGFSHKELPSVNTHEICFPYTQDSNYITVTPDVWRQAVDIKDISDDVFQTAYNIMEHIYSEYRYVQGATTVSTHANAVMKQKSGVCQDFAHVMVSYCRALGIPARYVSGYFYDATWDHHLRGAQASHAWVEVYIRDQGWVGLDPTNNKVVDSTYVLLASGRDYSDVAPLIGTYTGAPKSRLEVSVSVELLDEHAGEDGFEQTQSQDQKQSQS